MLFLDYFKSLVIIFCSSENTWEPSGHLDCPDLIAEFEDKKKKRELERKRKQNGEEDGASKKKKKLSDVKSSASSKKVYQVFQTLKKIFIAGSSRTCAS